MGRGPYESSLKEFVECLDSLDKDKPYTFEELEDICNKWYDTIRDYMSIRLSEVNVKLRKKGKTVKPTTVTKQICQTRTYPGLVVDPPISVNRWLVGLGILEFVTPFLTHILIPKITKQKQQSRGLKLIRISRHVNCCGRRMLVKKDSSSTCTICGRTYFMNADMTILSLRHVAD